MDMSLPNPELPPVHHTARTRLARHTAALLSTLVLMSTSLGASAAAPKVGDAFPELGTAGLEGTLPELKGKVVLVDFWASWCGPCKKSFPVMADLHQKYAPRGFAIVAISVDEQKAAMDGFVKKAQPPFAIVRDAKGRLAEIAGIDKMPTSYLVGGDGKILAVHSGFDGEATRKEYVREIEAALQAAGK